MRISASFCPPAAIFLACLAFSCSKELQKETRQNFTDGKYDSEFPGTPTSEQLSQISGSIYMINCIGSYKTLTFDEKERILVSSIDSQLLNQRNSSAQYSDNSVRGTATVIFNDGHKIGFLTCAHVVLMPDTVLSYYRDSNRHLTKYVRSIAIKIKQFNFVSPLPEEGSVDVIMKDGVTDIAIVGKNVSSQFAFGIPRFRYRLGKAAELKWGTFAYVFSCPAGVKMVTQALVSLSARDPEESFYIDAVLGAGSSGGIVLAIRDGIPNFELVGIVRVIQARFSNVLAPKEGGEEGYDSGTTYTGEAVVTKRVDLEYGVTRCISADAIRSVLEQNKNQLEQLGYNLSAFVDRH